MNKESFEFDLSPNPRKEIHDKIFSISTNLFDSVKNAPLSMRNFFPTILKNNNFSLTVRVTKKYAILEVTSKSRSQKSRELDRITAYRNIFCRKNSGQSALFEIDNATIVRIGSMTLEGSYAFSLGSDFSFCAWDINHISKTRGRPITNKIDILYVVGFGKKIHEDDAWLEFDTIIRVTLNEWSAKNERP